ncbi:MAG: IPT/TIG domain-containing protein [Vicinamibacterales bacterium]
MLLVILFGGWAEAAVTLAWDPNPESDLAGYIISYGTSSRQYTTSIDVGDTTTWVFSQPDTTKVYFLAVQAYNTAGLQSPYSNEVSTTPVIQPLTATSLTSSAPAQPCIGTTITFAATATGGVAPYAYKWWVFDGSTSTIGQNWSTSSTFAWTPTQPKPSYVVTVWVRSASSTADNLDNPGATLSMTVAVGGPAPAPASAPTVGANPAPSTGAVTPSPGSTDSTGGSNSIDQNGKLADAPKQIPSSPASTPTVSSNATSPVSAASPRAGVTTRPLNANRGKESRARTDDAQTVRPAQTPIIIVNAILPVSTGASNPGSSRVATRSNDQGPAEVADRTEVGSHEILPTYEPPPPSPPALTVSGHRTASREAVARSSQSKSGGVLTRSRRERRRRAEAAVQEASSVPSPAPTVTSVVPNSGSAKGGTTITITGADFVPGATVSFDGIPAATLVVVATSTTIVATTPSHAGGPVNVMVTNPDKQGGTHAAGFTFIAPARRTLHRPGPAASPPTPSSASPRPSGWWAVLAE